MSGYAYGQGKRSLRPVIATEDYDDPAVCGRRIRAYRGRRAKTCARRKGHPGPCRPLSHVATWGGRYKPVTVTADGRCRGSGYLAGSPGCMAECGSAA